MRLLTYLFTLVFCFSLSIVVAQSDNLKPNENDDPVAESMGAGYTPVCPQAPCLCKGGLKEIQLVYLGASGVDIEFYYTGSLNPANLISSFSNVQEGDVLTITTPPGTKFNQYTFIKVIDGGTPNWCKTKFFSECILSYDEGALDEYQIVGRTYGDFTVVGYVDNYYNSSCTLNDVSQDWRVGGNVVGNTKNTLGTQNDENMVFISRNQARGVLTNDGNFGLGVLSPSERLEVGGNSLLDGNATITGLAHVANTTGSTSATDGALIVDGGAGINENMHVGGNVGINTTANYPLDVNGQSHLNGNVGIGATPGSEQLLVEGTSFLNGNLGVGTNPGSQRLQVSGTSFLDGNVGVGAIPGTDRLQVGGSSFLNGNVGINTSPTAFSLEVAGESNFQGRVKIGALNFPTFSGGNAYILSVGGGILAEEVLVRLQPWADYVFDSGYKLMPLEEVEQFTKDNGHLPGVTPAAEVEEEGLNLGTMQNMQMEKIEELYLHVIELNKQMKTLQQENERLKAKLEELEK